MDAHRPLSPHYAEHYWSGGAAEKTHVYIHTNSLPQRFATATGFTIAELGFGTGLTFLLTLDLWQKTAPPDAHLTFISYELHPLSLSDLTTIHAAFPAELQDLATRLRAALNLQPGWNTCTFGKITLKLYVGAAATGILTHPQPADCWFLDGFSPSNNPALWTPELLKAVATHTNPGGTATTYSVAHLIQRNLKAAGLTIDQTPGHPPKRFMLKAVKPE